MIRSSTDIELVFSGEMSNAPLDCVLCYRDTITLKTPKSREKNEGSRLSQNSNQFYNWIMGNVVLLQKIWLFYKTSEKHHKWDIYIP